MKIKVVVKNTEKEAFDLGMKLIALDETPFDGKFTCNGYKIIDNKLFLSRYSKECEQFPYKYNLEQTINFAWGWYEANKKPSYNEPDTDGSTEIAFELTTEGCGVGSDDWGLFCSIKPIWFIYGK